MLCGSENTLSGSAKAAGKQVKLYIKQLLSIKSQQMCLVEMGLPPVQALIADGHLKHAVLFILGISDSASRFIRDLIAGDVN